MTGYVCVILLAAWLGWFMAFPWRKRRRRAQRINRQARWGILLEGTGLSIIWQDEFWMSEPGWLITMPATFLLATAVFLAWAGVRALGHHWRIDAGLNADHRLILGGPYAYVRHPIYASMLCLLLGTGVMISSWPWLLAATLLFLIGTEIRVQVEDRLLAAQFAKEFADYKRRVPAYIPWIR